MKVLIDSKIRLVGEVHDSFLQSDIKNEPMLFNCNLDHAIKFGGPITRAFIQCLPYSFIDGPLIIDSRVHMLMPGWYPCIPGWHHDDVPRTAPNGQPNYYDSLRSQHVMMLVNGDICPTEFMLGTNEMEIPSPDKTLYEEWDREISKNMWMDRVSCPDLSLIEFNDRTWHRGTPAVGNGFRFFIRASKHSVDGVRCVRGDGWKNELRQQVQVYIDPINKGW